MTGPRGKGGTSQDSYDGAAPNTIAPVPPKQINATDSKLGTPKFGTTAGAGINHDTFHE